MQQKLNLDQGKTKSEIVCDNIREYCRKSRVKQHTKRPKRISVNVLPNMFSKELKA